MAVTVRLADSAHGVAAVGVPVRLEKQDHNGLVTVAATVSGTDGWVTDWPLDGAERIGRGVYRLTLDTDAYFAGLGVFSFCSEIAITFYVTDPGERNHVTVVVAPYGFMAYRDR